MSRAEQLSILRGKHALAVQLGKRKIAAALEDRMRRILLRQLKAENRRDKRGAA